MPFLTLAATKQHYRSIFTTAASLLQQQANAYVAQSGHCTVCEALAHQHGLEHGLWAPSHEACSWHEARRAMHQFLNQRLASEILAQLELMQTARNKVACGQTGQCCRLASSEASWEQLQAKAMAGDTFAQQFTSIFLPYASLQAAQHAFPEVVERVVAYATEQAQGNYRKIKKV